MILSQVGDSIILYLFIISSRLFLMENAVFTVFNSTSETVCPIQIFNLEKEYSICKNVGLVTLFCQW